MTSSKTPPRLHHVATKPYIGFPPPAAILALSAPRQPPPTSDDEHEDNGADEEICGSWENTAIASKLSAQIPPRA
ncbi:hypothetical protein RB195_007786 [Necator americanus]|uniref:Uncharacterized protein n=1 Tax=Necator americanus TaxID=51031 RepID=A0ABR1BYY9_NECAM